MPCCGDLSDALVALEALDNVGGNPDCVGGNSDWISCDPVDVHTKGRLVDVKVDDCWVNFCCKDHVALPLVQLKGQHDVKKSGLSERQITFVDKPDVETVVIDDCLFQRQTPPTSFWEDDRVLSFVPDRDGYASYGRPQAFWVHEHVLTIETATKMSRGKSLTYEHRGKVPPWASVPDFVNARNVIRYVDSEGHSAAASPEEQCNPIPRETIKLLTPARPVVNGKVVEPPWYVVSLAEGTIKIWLVDTGCGHDLIGKNEVASSGGKCRPAKESLTFNTANGKTVALEQASYQSTELNEEIDAYVLDSTPAVMSVGKRCMNMGYSFHWPSGKNYFLVCLDDMIVELDVHGA